jgi:c(7)-type cytochrome triheme protein
MRLALVAWMAVAALAAAQPADRFPLRPNAPPVLYGDLLIQRSTAGTAVQAVAFSHWKHRLRYTCRVCHLELDFAFARHGTAITEEENRAGRFCGACHDGKTAFDCRDSAQCTHCHTGQLQPDPAAYFRRLADLPRAQYGNGVDWSVALARGLIAPAVTITGDEPQMDLETVLTLEADWNFVSPAVFPHKEHVRWLDCANCHPAVFDVKRKGTRFSMRSALGGHYCGSCHLRVAFPLNDCRRCHPAMKENPL